MMEPVINAIVIYLVFIVLIVWMFWAEHNGKKDP